MPRELNPEAGLSPQVRGNPGRGAGHERPDGSIPAGAGEPAIVARPRRSRRVYPRRCGGTEAGRVRAGRVAGLSPQVRGNRIDAGVHVSPARSIPAGAGEPQTAAFSAVGQRVYPRRYGGTEQAHRLRVPIGGLSPQVRGNRDRLMQGSLTVRSIPAGAGEPEEWRLWPRMAGVYPRRCGGTTTSGRSGAPGTGLSPQVRGNPVQAIRPIRCVRSIPAGAGEPGRAGARTPTPAVYPRRCGGTGYTNRHAYLASGLSPQVQGNLGRERAGLERIGSIPAGAGEPGPSRPARASMRVYPRRCGGT